MKNFFASNVTKLLEKHNMSPFALSERLGVHSATVYRWLDPEFLHLPRARTRRTEVRRQGASHHPA